jgi:cystathionine beta-lyase
LQVSLGVIPALYALAEYLCALGDKILILTPAYGYFQRACAQTGHELVSPALIVKEGVYEVDFADFAAKVKDPSVTLFFLCHPHNPTGRTWTEQELRRTGEICFANGVRIISDEVHADLLRSGKRHLPLVKLFPDSRDIITCMAVSKTFNLAGLMLATVVIPDATYLAWIDLSAYFPEPVNLTRFFLEKVGVILEGAEMFVSNGGCRVRLEWWLPCSSQHRMPAARAVERPYADTPGARNARKQLPAAA